MTEETNSNQQNMRPTLGDPRIKRNKNALNEYVWQKLLKDSPEDKQNVAVLVTREKGAQDDTSDVLSALAAHLPIQLAKRYGEKMCFVKYHISEDKSSIVESSGGVQTIHNVSAYHEPTF